MKKGIKTNEELFYETLHSLFIGHTIEGKGGFVKLYKVKEMYYQKLVNEIKREVEKYGKYKEEIYGLLNEFLNLFDNKFSTIYLKESISQQLDRFRRIW